MRRMNKYELLEKNFRKNNMLDDNGVEEKNPKLENEKKRILYITHLNIVLYALCYWIQIGVLPVSICHILKHLDLSFMLNSSVNNFSTSPVNLMSTQKCLVIFNLLSHLSNYVVVLYLAGLVICLVDSQH